MHNIVQTNPNNMDEKKCKIEMIGGAEGSCLSLNDFRIAGPKPWGGGSVTKSWDTSIENVLTAIADRHENNKVVYNFWHNGDYKVTFERIKK